MCVSFSRLATTGRFLSTSKKVELSRVPTHEEHQSGPQKGSPAPLSIVPLCRDTSLRPTLHHQNVEFSIDTERVETLAITSDLDLAKPIRLSQGVSQVVTRQTQRKAVSYRERGVPNVSNDRRHNSLREREKSPLGSWRHCLREREKKSGHVP